MSELYISFKSGFRLEELFNNRALALHERGPKLDPQNNIHCGDLKENGPQREWHY